MTAILKVDEIQDTSGNNIINENANTVTIGKSGDTVNVVGTLNNNGSAVTSYTDSDALSLFNASGSAPVYACRAWIKFNGQGTVSIYGSGNVSSLTDISTGSYRVNLTTALDDTNYSICINSGGGLLGTAAQEFPVNVADWTSTSQIDWNQRKCDNDNNTFVSADADPVSLAVFR